MPIINLIFDVGMSMLRFLGLAKPSVEEKQAHSCDQSQNTDDISGYTMANVNGLGQDNQTQGYTLEICDHIQDPPPPRPGQHGPTSQHGSSGQYGPSDQYGPPHRDPLAGPHGQLYERRPTPTAPHRDPLAGPHGQLYERHPTPTAPPASPQEPHRPTGQAGLHVDDPAQLDFGGSEDQTVLNQRLCNNPHQRQPDQACPDLPHRPMGQAGLQVDDPTQPDLEHTEEQSVSNPIKDNKMIHAKN